MEVKLPNLMSNTFLEQLRTFLVEVRVTREIDEQAQMVVIGELNAMIGQGKDPTCESREHMTYGQLFERWINDYASLNQVSRFPHRNEKLCLAQ